MSVRIEQLEVDTIEMIKYMTYSIVQKQQMELTKTNMLTMKKETIWEERSKGIRNGVSGRSWE